MEKKLISSKNSKNTKNTQFLQRLVNSNSKFETTDFSNSSGSKISHKIHGKKQFEVGGRILPIEERDSTVDTVSQDTSRRSSFASVMTSLPISTTDPLIDQAIEEEIPRDEQEIQNETDMEIIPITGMTLTISPSVLSSTAEVIARHTLPTKRQSSASFTKMRRSELMLRGAKRVEQWLELRQTARGLSRMSIDQPIIITGSKGCLADVLDKQILMLRRKNFATQTDWRWKVMAERWRHGRLIFATGTSTTFLYRRRKEPKLKSVVERVMSTVGEDFNSLVSDMSSVPATDKCVDTGDLIFSYPQHYHTTKHIDHLKKMTHHGKRISKRLESYGFRGSDDSSIKDHHESVESQKFDEDNEDEPSKTQNEPDKPEGEC